MTIAHNLGFPRIGLEREMKKALELYWKGLLTESELLEEGKRLRAAHWQMQAKAGLTLLPVGDFSWYDHVLDMSVMLGNVPHRYGHVGGDVPLDTLFLMARGRASQGADVLASEMTKWFDTNYHYIVPEFSLGQTFRLASQKLFEEIAEAKALGYQVKPVILGPLSYLYLGKIKDGFFDKLGLLPALLPVYSEILQNIQALGIEWVQIDEPILVLNLEAAWQQAFETVYQQLQVKQLKILLTTYFGALQDNTGLVAELPVAGIHIDCVKAPEQLSRVLDRLPGDKILSLGVIDGRNIWRAHLNALLDILEPIQVRLGNRLWVAPSCSLLHCPIDLSREELLEEEIKQLLAFGVQKIEEVVVLAKALQYGRVSVAPALVASQAAVDSRRASRRVHDKAVKARMALLTPSLLQRTSLYGERAKKQQARLGLPLFPTTTIGSFPQTEQIRQLRQAVKAGQLSKLEYHSKLQEEIAAIIAIQETLGLHVLVHGEPERSDLVEYFAEHLTGMTLTQQGWVQSYGSRCVKPPLIYGDISRPTAITVEWICYAQSLTTRPVKGMLTGPVTLLNWSFARDDQPREETAMQLALALSDEVKDLEAAGVAIIQVDEPAFREALPLRYEQWPYYLQWAVRAFRLATAGAKDSTQIHSHMCYSEFNDIMSSIAELDADVITIESSRSQMELLDVFKHFDYPNAIGPGVYDIHSPHVPATKEIAELLTRAARHIPAERLWVNPDCGLKTRDWPEVEAALLNMVKAAQWLREKRQVVVDA